MDNHNPCFDYLRDIENLLSEANKQLVHLNGVIKKMKRNYLRNCQEIEKTKQQLENEKENNDSTDRKLQLNIRILTETVELQTKFNESLSELLQKSTASKAKLIKLKVEFLTVEAIRCSTCSRPHILP